MLTLLCKLNLSRTNVSDVGVANLKLPQLTLLNLDWTSTTEHCPNLLEGRSSGVYIFSELTNIGFLKLLASSFLSATSTYDDKVDTSL